MFGMCWFVDFQQNLGIVCNIFCDWLVWLLENGVLVKQDVGEYGICYEYWFIDKGWDLFMVIIVLCQWSDCWNGESNGLELVDWVNGELV